MVWSARWLMDTEPGWETESTAVACGGRIQHMPASQLVLPTAEWWEQGAESRPAPDELPAGWGREHGGLTLYWGVTCQEEGKDSCVCDWCVGVVSKYACVHVYEGIQALLRARLVSCRGPDGRREGGELDSRVFGESDKSDKISLELKLCCQHVLSWPAFCPPLSPVNPPPLCPAQGLALRWAHIHLVEQIWRHGMVSESFF